MNTIWPLKTDNPPFRKPDSCKTCPLYGKGMGFGFPELGGTNGVGVVVEALGEQEALTGKPLQGTAGWQFNHVLHRGGIERESFTFIDNVLHCRPPENRLVGQPYEMEATQKCAMFLDDTIRVTQPKVILAMGNIPLKRVASQTGAITRNRGFVYDSPYNIPVVGTFHPSYLLPHKKEKSSSKYTWVMIMDIRKAIRIASGNRRMFPQHYLMDPPVDQAIQFMNQYEGQTEFDTMAWDLETLYKMKTKSEQKLKLEDKQTVTRLNLAWKQGYALTMPWREPYLSKVIIPFFRLNRPKVGWNSKYFDEPILIGQEHMELNGTLHDGMDMFHVFQPNIERNLEFATSLLTDHLKPWKHLSQSEEEFYACVDADATISDFYMLREAMSGIRIPEYV